MINYIGVGKIPIESYLKVMDIRCYSRELTVEYTKDIYGEDISEEVKEIAPCWEYRDINIYELFVKENPPKSIDDNTREYFQKEGRKRYIKFYKSYKDSEVYDLAMDMFSESNVIHHIFPLVFGGGNGLMNLIPITDFNHKLLHENSVEQKRECCFMATDYLTYLYTFKGIFKLNEKYDIMHYKDFSGRFKHNFLNTIMETEMRSFYDKLTIAEGDVS